MKLVNLISILLIFSFNIKADDFQERKAFFAIIKPGAITTLLAINHGIVSHVHAQLGDNLAKGGSAIEVTEKETTRTYRTAIKGNVAKLHVTMGAAVTPGMPLTTIIDPEEKQIEVSLSSQEAESVQVGSFVYFRNKQEIFGRIQRMSSLVDPDTGAVTAFIQPEKKVKNLIGDVLPVDISIRTIKDCKIVSIKDLDQFIDSFDVISVSKNQACLKNKKTEK